MCSFASGCRGLMAARGVTTLAGEFGFELLCGDELF
jgi:hypothetical protein